MHIDISPEIPLHPFMALKDDPQYEYKLALRDWMRTRGLSMRWLASWLEKSETTVKNFLYGTKPISEENKEKIEALQVEYEDGEYSDHTLPLGHHLMALNPNFDPVPKKITYDNKSGIICYLSKKTTSILRSLNLSSISPPTYMYYNKFYIYSYEEVNEFLYEITKETISSYMKEENIGVEKLISSFLPAAYLDSICTGSESEENLTEEEKCLRNSNSRLNVPNQIFRYALIAAAIAGASYVDEWIDRVVYEWARQKQVNDLTKFLDL